MTETWHHGLVAAWWDEFNQGGPEIDFYRPWVESGQPALDLGCGTGRVLLPYLRSGLDVDGCDASPDMLARCRARAAREGLEPRLTAQAAHELDLPRRYGTIYMCGTLGLGGSTADDYDGLRRVHAHLEPGGTFLVDNEVPTGEHPPREFGEPRRRRASDGAEYGLASRLAEIDTTGRRVVYEMRASKWVDGELVAEEQHTLRMTIYDTDDVLRMLAGAGFVDVELRAGWEDRPPEQDDAFVVFVARP